MIDVCKPSALRSVRAVLDPFVKPSTGAVLENVEYHCGNFSSLLRWTFYLLSDVQRTSIAGVPKAFVL